VRSKLLLLALVAVGIAAATVLALLANSVLGVERDLRRADQALAFGAGDPDAASHERGLSVRVGESILGVTDDAAYRDAAELAESSLLPKQAPGVVVERRAEAEAMLVRIVRADSDPVLRSHASNLLGVLLFEDAKTARANPRRYLEQSLGAFQDAVTFDPSFDVAKANLELLATLPPGTSFSNIGTSGSDASASGGQESGY
jgi:hypothetical protein